MKVWLFIGWVVMVRISDKFEFKSDKDLPLMHLVLISFLKGMLIIRVVVSFVRGCEVRLLILIPIFLEKITQKILFKKYMMLLIVVFIVFLFSMILIIIASSINSCYLLNNPYFL